MEREVEGAVFLEALTSLMAQRISTWRGHSYHRYVSWLPAALPAKQQFSTLLQVFTLHFGTATF